jgi:hypothetical protein
MFRMKMQHYSCYFAPVSTLRIRVEQAQIRDEVFFVVNGQHGIGGRGIGDIGSSGGFCMGILATCREQKGCPLLLSRTDIFGSDAMVGNEWGRRD